MSTNQYEIEIKQLIDDLIQSATTYDVDALERIYHDDMQVIMLDPQGQIMLADKAAFKGLFATKRDNNEPALNTWADFHRIEADENKGHVLISRKIKLMEEEQKTTLSIDLVNNESNWQVIREVIFIHAGE